MDDLDRDLDRDLSDLDCDLSDVDRDLSDVDRDLSDLDRDLSDLDHDLSDLSVRGVQRLCSVGCILWGTYPGTTPGCFRCTRAYTRVHLGYPSIEPGCFGHTRVYIRVHLGYAPGCLGHTRVYTRVHLGYAPGCLGHARVYTRVHLGYTHLVVWAMLGYIPGYIWGTHTWLFGSYSGIYPGASGVPECRTCFFGRTRVYTCVHLRKYTQLNTPFVFY